MANHNSQFPKAVDIGGFLEVGLKANLKPDLIRGLLRQGQKMIVQAPSKAGKSFLMIELALCLTEGRDFLNFKCVKTDVLYLNMEIDGESFKDRCSRVYARYGIERTCDSAKLLQLPLRGYYGDLEDIITNTITQARDMDVGVIIIDPIYKLTGDENNKESISFFARQLDRLAEETGASIIYVHHHSKGAQSYKASMDRSSGSGVFARDADAILDMIEVEVTEGKQEELLNRYHDRGLQEKALDHISAWKAEFTLREYAHIQPQFYIFDYPVHIWDNARILENSQTMDRKRSRADGAEERKKKKAQRKETLRNYLCDNLGYYEQGLESGSGDGSEEKRAEIPLKEIHEYMQKDGEISIETVKNYLKEMSEFNLTTKAGGKGTNGGRSSFVSLANND